MRRNAALQTIFAIFLGLVLVSFVWIGLLTFYPEPEWTDDGGASRETWRLIFGVLLLVIATVVSAVSLSLSRRLEVIANGLLLGGVFTMISSVGMAFSMDSSGWRFAVVTAALLLTIAVGYLRFARRPRAAESEATPVAKDESAAAVDADLVARVEKLESGWESLRRALD
jgi:hypothetical protein